MGLVVSSFSGLNWLTDVETPLSDGFFDPSRKIVHLVPHDDFLTYADGLAAGFYRYEDSICCFEAGPYAHFSQWREWLAKIAGYDATEHEDFRHCPHLLTSWLAASGPLHSYLNFSDCEGLVGAATSRRMRDDFLAVRDAVLRVSPRAAERLDRWTELFALASNNGAVVYH